jgi:hypothetical protein
LGFTLPKTDTLSSPIRVFTPLSAFGATHRRREYEIQDGNQSGSRAAVSNRDHQPKDRAAREQSHDCESRLRDTPQPIHMWEFWPRWLQTKGRLAGMPTGGNDPTAVPALSRLAFRSASERFQPRWNAIKYGMLTDYQEC